MHSSLRRWFQFKLSAWFMLVGIVARAMMLKLSRDYGSCADNAPSPSTAGISTQSA